MNDPYKKFSGELVVDGRRGVIYFHDVSGVTILRICQLDLERAGEMERPFIDVTVGYGVAIQEQIV